MSTTRAIVRLELRGYAVDGKSVVIARAMPFELVIARARDGEGRARAMVHLTPHDGRSTFTRYRCALSAQAFEELRAAQSLTVEDAWACAEVCEKALKAAPEGPDRAFAGLVCHHGGGARLEIVEDGGHRLMSVLELDFVQVDDATVRDEVAREYGMMKVKLAEYERRFGVLA